MEFKYTGTKNIPEKTKILYVITNTELPRHLPISIHTLIYRGKDITRMSENFPIYLRELNCSHTRITRLPDLPNCLRVLRCSDTEIRSLPALPWNLQELDCENTKITSLPNLPNNLQCLNCRYTPLMRFLPMEFQCNYNALAIISWFKSKQNSSELEKYQKEIEELKKKNKELEEQIKIMPGGSEYFKAMERYGQRREEALNKN